MRNFKIIILIMLAFLLTACGHEKTDVAPLSSFNATVPVQTIWHNSVGKGEKKEYVKLTPVLLGDQIYVNSFNGQISAMDVQTGKRLWSKNTKHRLTTGLGGDENYLFVGTKDGEILSISRDSGNVVWQTPLDNEVLARPNGSGSIIVAKSVDDRVYGLKKQNGQVLWSYKESAPELALRGGGTIQVDAGLAAIGFEDGQVGVFSLKNGEMLWKQIVGTPQGTTIIDTVNDVNDSLLVMGGTVYAAAYQGSLSALGLRSGQVLWSHDLSSYAGLAADSHKVYATNVSGEVVAFDRRTGEVLWKQNKLLGRGLTGPAVVGSNVIVVGDSKGYVHWLSAEDGHFVARTQVDKSGILATPLSNGNDVYVYANSGRLVKYRI